MLKLIQISNFWYAVSKNNELRCSDVLAGIIETWRPVVRLPRPVFLALAAEFGDAMRNIAIEEVPSTLSQEPFTENVTEVALENVAGADKYVTYHCVVTATE